jgi:hypothetical protein
MGCIARTFAVVIVIVAASIRSASAQAADMQVRIDRLSFAPHRLTADGSSGKAPCSFARRGLKGWIALHRPDGEDIYIKIDQIVFVMSAKDTGADQRVRSKIQLLNGHSDVRESVEEVMRAIESDVSVAKDGM